MCSDLYCSARRSLYQPAAVYIRWAVFPFHLSVVNHNVELGFMVCIKKDEYKISNNKQDVLFQFND